MTVSPCQRLGDAACLPKARFEIRLRLRTHVAAAGASRITPHMEGMHASQCVIARESAGRRMTRKSRIVNPPPRKRSEEHTSELQSLMRISYAVFCLKKKNIVDKQDTTK